MNVYRDRVTGPYAAWVVEGADPVRFTVTTCEGTRALIIEARSRAGWELVVHPLLRPIQDDADFLDVVKSMFPKVRPA